MYTDINLVIDKKKSGESSERIKKLRYISFVILFIVAVSSLLIFIFNLRFSANLIKEQQKKEINSLGNFDTTATKIIALNLRVKEINQIIELRKEYQNILGLVVDNLNESISISEFSFAQKEFKFTVFSSSLFDLNNFLNSILKLENQDEVQNVSLQSLEISRSQFSMTVIINLR